MVSMAVYRGGTKVSQTITFYPPQHIPLASRLFAGGAFIQTRFRAGSPAATWWISRFPLDIVGIEI